MIVASLQMRSTRDPRTNRDQALMLLREAVERGALYCQTPEMTGLVERNKNQLMEVVQSEEDDIVLAALREAARQYKITIHIGSLAIKTGEKLANRAFVIDDSGEVTARYDKIHLFDVDLGSESWRESATYQGGEKAVIAPVGEVKIGLSICYDLRFPALYRTLAERGADILTAPACFTKITGEAHWHILQRARAIETGSFMISAAQGGLHEDGRTSYGHSLIIDPWGRILAEGGTEPGVVCATLDLPLVAETRARIPALKNAREFTI